MDVPGYTIIRELGRGGMATVYLARQDRLGRQVALKVMTPVPGVGDEFTARFIKEGHIVARLQHPQIVTIYDLDSVDELQYFSMEFLPNGTLADQIIAGLSESKAIDITRRVAQALSIAHDKGVIHRDIKPQNILFRTDGTPVLTDFGIARAASTGAEATALTSVGMIVGSPRYMSPEQSMSRPVDARSDLYSLGCVFHEMLTRELPYHADDVISLAMQHCSAPLPELPIRLARYQPIIDRMLAKDPEERFGSAQALVQALAQLEQGIDFASAPDEDEATVVATQALQSARASSPAATRAAPTPILRPEPQAPDATSPRSKRLPIIAIGALALLAISTASYFGLTSRDVSDPLLEITRQLPPPAPGRSPTNERYENLALEHLRAGEFDQSLELIHLALATHPKDARLHAIEGLIEDHRAATQQLEQARALLTQGHTVESLSTIDQGLKRVPNHPALKALRTEALAAQQQDNRTTADTRRQQAEQALDAGQLAEALRHVREGLAAVADDSGLLELQRRVQQALETDRNVRGILSSATNLIAEGLLQDSLDLIDKGLALTPGDSALTDLRATVEKQIQRQQERQADNLRQQAETQLQQGALEQALAAIERALILQPEDPALQDTRQRILDAQQARHVQRFLTQANTALDAGRPQQALKLVDSALELIPNDEPSLTLRKRIQARITQDKLIGQNQAAAEALSTQAGQLFAQGGSQQALVLIEQARRLDADNPAVIDLGQRIAAEQAAEDARKQAINECTRLNPSHASPAVKLNTMTAAVDCLLSIPKIVEQPAQLTEPLDRIRSDLTLWAAKPPPAELAMKAFALLGRLESVHPDSTELRKLRTSLARQAGLMPEVVEIKGGCFLIGSPDTDSPRELDESQRQVCVEGFALATNETLQRDFARFVADADYRTDAERGTGGAEGCLSLDRQAAEPWSYHAWANWREPNKYQKPQDDHPVTCISANDARAYLHWLTETTGVPYRLPTEAEWEYAARASTQTPTFWGNAPASTCAHANVADSGHDWTNSFDCDDGYEWIAPVKRFAPNPWGLHDMLGNASEWTCSEYSELYDSKETQCAAPESRAPVVMRGGGWNGGPANLRSAYRNRNYPESRFSFVGFRIARDGTAATDKASSTDAASGEATEKDTASR